MHTKNAKLHSTDILHKNKCPLCNCITQNKHHEEQCKTRFMKNIIKRYKRQHNIMFMSKECHCNICSDVNKLLELI